MSISSLKRAFVGCVIVMVLSTIWLVSYTHNTSLINMKTRVASSFVLLPSVAKKECPKVSLSKKPLPPTVLVSFPGSGNTWTRHLLEQMTGVATGSDYFDKKLEAGGFLGESKMDGSTIAVKIHDLYKPQSMEPLRDIKRAILIIRNPYNAMVADFNRLNSKSHVGTVSLPIFVRGVATGSDLFDKYLEAGWFLGERKMDGSTIAVKTHFLYIPLLGKPLPDIKRAILIIRNPYHALVADFSLQESKSHVGTVSLPIFIRGWKTYLSKWTKRWFELNHSWITQMDNLLVIFYENLQKHLEQELTRLYSFLDDGSFHGNIQCALNNTEGNFHRNRSKELPISFVYGDSDVRLMNRYINDVNILLKKYNHSFFDISSYKIKL